MILKEADDRSAGIAELKLLESIAPASFRPAVQKQIENIYSGIAGERDAAHFLKREFGSSERTAVLHDLRIGVDGEYAQIDHLVIHRIQGAAWVLETKNYSGRLSCDEHGDWTVWRNGKPTSIASPVNQARRQCEVLRQWLDANGIRTIQKINAVVLISPTSSIDRRKLPSDAHIVKSDNFGDWWRKQTDGIGLGTALGMVGRHMVSGMSREDLKALGERLVYAHVPATFDWRAKLRLPHPKTSDPSGPPPANAELSMGVVEDAPRTVSTAHGAVNITRLPDGRYALRNEKNDALIEIVRSACKGRAQWIPRYRNWLVRENELTGILAAITSPRATCLGHTGAPSASKAG
ncbi:MAG TPA: nuclease-related domain-containing protein [Sphingomonadaceae bacterium]|nr:nuclease-related domain-containing protein [Sphingomonadaceae bacterium]